MKVKELLNKDNWIKGFLGIKDTGKPTLSPYEATSFCLVGAVCRCYGFIGNQKFDIYKQLKSAIHEVTGKDFQNISTFNDDENTTWEMVEKVLTIADV